MVDHELIIIANEKLKPIFDKCNVTKEETIAVIHMLMKKSSSNNGKKITKQLKKILKKIRN